MSEQDQSPETTPPTENAEASGETSRTPPETPAADEISALVAERDALRAELDAARESQLRTLADFDNFRRRVQKDKEEVRALAVGRVLEDLVPVYDTLSIALQSLQGTADPAVIAKGIGLIQTQFKNAFERSGVTEINPDPGAEFDPNRHESIAAQPHASVPEGKVAAVFRTGFAAGTRILRPASVVLSSGPAPTAEN